MSEIKLTDKQRQTLRIIVSLTKLRGYPPTVAEIAKRAKKAPYAIQGRLDLMEKKGVISRAKGIARSIQLTELGKGEI